MVSHGGFLFLFLFYAALGLCCFTQALSSCLKRGLLYSSLSIGSLLSVVSAPVAEAWALGRVSAVVISQVPEAQAQWLWCMGHSFPWLFLPPRSLGGIFPDQVQPVSALAGGSSAESHPGVPFTLEPPGSPFYHHEPPECH